MFQFAVYSDEPAMIEALADNMIHVINEIRLQLLEKIIQNWTAGIRFIILYFNKQIGFKFK